MYNDNDNRILDLKPIIHTTSNDFNMEILIRMSMTINDTNVDDNDPPGRLRRTPRSTIQNHLAKSDCLVEVYWLRRTLRSLRASRRRGQGRSAA